MEEKKGKPIYFFRRILAYNISTGNSFATFLRVEEKKTKNLNI